uniref:bacterial Ig-like domain-containing protein n=1 Tax=Lactococcus garvieae TaxID=1363 RepID=UPI00359C7C43
MTRGEMAAFLHRFYNKFNKQSQPVVDKTSLKVKDSTLYVNDPWQAKDNFVSATDKNGKAVAFNQVKVSGQVNTQSAGKYTITYSYGGKTATATVTVKEDKTALKLQETRINKYVGDTYGENELRDNITGLTNKDGQDVLATDKNKVQITAKDAQHQEVALSDLTQKVGTYTITYSYEGYSIDAIVTVKEDKTALKLQETSINKYVGDTYGENELRDNITGLTNKDGQDVLATDKNKVQITAEDAQHQNVTLAALTQKAGNYTITYSYEGKTATLTLAVTVDPSAPVLSADGQEVQFMNQSWSVLRGTAELGVGNYLVAAQKALKEVPFNNSVKFFETNDRNDRHADGYLTSNVKAEIDTWYDDHVKGTALEHYVQPVALPNPTLGDMIDLGILKSNTENGDSDNWYLTHDAKYRTRVDESHGVKQAFAMSSADVSSGKCNNVNTTDFTSEALAWRDKLRANGVKYTCLRSPGACYNSNAGVFSGRDFVHGYNIVTAASGVVPMLVVHVP